MGEGGGSGSRIDVGRVTKSSSTAAVDVVTMPAAFVQAHTPLTSLETSLGMDQDLIDQLSQLQ